MDIAKWVSPALTFCKTKFNKVPQPKPLDSWAITRWESCLPGVPKSKMKVCCQIIELEVDAINIIFHHDSDSVFYAYLVDTNVLKTKTGALTKYYDTVFKKLTHAAKEPSQSMVSLENHSDLPETERVAKEADELKKILKGA